MLRGKSRRDRNLPDADHFDSFDEATSSCDKIAAIAKLLASCQTQHLRTETISVAGSLIIDEAARLCQSLNVLGRSHRSKKTK
jgi:hypothetical protein